MQAKPESTSSTRVAVLGTLAEFHREPIPYDLEALVQLVANLKPDFVCLEMTSEQWQQQDFGNLPPEYREALLPLAYQTDMVVVPIAEADPPAEPTASGWRGWLIYITEHGHCGDQRSTTAPSPVRLN